MPDDRQDQRHEIDVTIEMRSDWHIGIGAGRQHSIDRLVERDGDGLPYIPASTLRGIWRDAAEQLALGLDNGAHGGAWGAFVAGMFGTQIDQSRALDTSMVEAPRSSAVQMGSAHLSPFLRYHLTGQEADRKALREALFFIKPGVSIDERTGMSKQDHLRFEEMAMKGLVLSAKCWLDSSNLGAAAPTAIDILKASAALIERMGAKRRRGHGRCTVKACDDAELDEVLKHLTQLDAPPKIYALNTRSQGGSSSPAMAYGDRRSSAKCAEWQRRDLNITLLSPLVVPDEILGNVVTTKKSIPGSYLLPIVAGALRNMGVPNVSELITSGSLRVLSAEPEVNGIRGLPAPLCWEAPKAKTEPPTMRCAWDALNELPPHKALRAGFIDDTKSPAAFLTEPLTEVRTHNVIEDAKQRPTEDVGGVYTYEALSAGQVFRSQIHMQLPGFSWEALSAGLAGLHWLGRGKPAGYGQVSVTLAPEQTDTGAPELGNNLEVWLTSDLCLSDGRLEAAIDQQVLADHILEVLGLSGDVLNASIRVKRIDSWQSSWGLPRPTLVVIQAGSAVRVQLKSVPGDLIARLRMLEECGIGERRAEGFGCVLFNRSIVSAPRVDKELCNPSKPSAQSNEPKETENDRNVISLIYKRAWQRMLLTRSQIAARDVARDLGWKGAVPSSSQLGVLRSILGGTEPEASLNAWVNHALAKANKRSANESSKKWLLRLSKFMMAIDNEIPAALKIGNGEATSTRFVASPIPALPHREQKRLMDNSREFALRAILLSAIREAQRSRQRPTLQEGGHP